MGALFFMSRVGRKKRKKKTLIILIEIICLIAVGFKLYKILEKNREFSKQKN